MPSLSEPTVSNDKKNQQQHVVVVVLGDVGRSPRIQYHALSILEAGHNVSLVGYTGEALVPALNDDRWSKTTTTTTTESRTATTTGGDSGPRLNVVRFESRPPPAALRKILPLYYLWRLLSLVGGLIQALWFGVAEPADTILVQNPPAMPLLLIALLYKRYHRYFVRPRPRTRPQPLENTNEGTTTSPRTTRFIIDWHNLGYSMFRNGSLVQKLARVYETALAPTADGHLCVTRAMKEYLIQDMKIEEDKISVLYDCPPNLFRPMDLTEQHSFLSRVHDQLCQGCPPHWFGSLDTSYQTVLTELSPRGGGANAVSRPHRPLLITSSTSWTDDEDFDLLLEAMSLFNNKLLSSSSSPSSTTTNELKALVVITGKGPLKERYEEKMSRMSLERVSFQTVWLEPADYPRLLACADVGISLHTSTSGLDLPMKVLDLFGCQTPVCAVGFDCLDELVQDDVNGHVFTSSQQLANQLDELCGNKPAVASSHGFGKLLEYSKNVGNRKRWAENWNEHGQPMVLIK